MKLAFYINLFLLLAQVTFPVMLGRAYADNLGIHGRVYPIKENDLLAVLKSRAQAEIDSGKWEQRVDGWRDQAIRQANRPKGVSLPRAVESVSHLYDPSIIVPQDIRDTRGQLIQTAGSKVNPLSYTSLNRQLVFIDGDDRLQVDWMINLTEKEPERFKVILTNGAIVNLMQQLKRRLFFDQQQIYSTKLSIQSLPALVYQQGLYLRIDEVAIQ